MVEGIEQFNDIRPYEPEEMKQAFNDLLNDRQFNLIMKGFAPAVYEARGTVYHPQAYGWMYV